MSRQASWSAKTEQAFADLKLAMRQFIALLDRYDQKGDITLTQLDEMSETFIRLRESAWEMMCADRNTATSKAQQKELTLRLRRNMVFINDIQDIVSARYETIREEKP